MALPTGLIWEIRSGGNAANGGGFNPANANFITNLAVTGGEGTSATPHVSSATYTFVDADAGAWVYVKTGTGWNAGVFYKIVSQSGGVALLDAAIGHGVVLGGAAGGYNFTPTTVQGIGSATPGGNATWGVDYSQRDGNKLSLGDLLCTGSGSTTLTTLTASSFTPVMAGNLIHLTTQGTGNFGIIGWYEIVSVTDGTNVVLDVTPCNSGTPSAAVTGAVGGGIASLGAIGSVTARLGAVLGNVLCVTQGGGAAFSLGATDTLSFVGTGTLPIQIIGYGTYRGDGYLGRNTTSNGKLITTNMPNYGYQATFRLDASAASFSLISNINFTSAGTGVGSNALVTIGTVANNPNLIFRCVVTNPNTSAPGGLKIGTVTGGNNAYAFDCDVFLTGASGTGTALALNSTNSSAIACRIETSGTSGSITGITLGGAGSTVADCVVIGAGGLSGITAIGGIVMNCTVVGYIDGIKASGAIATLLVNNLITDNTTRAINNALVSNPTINFYNRLRDPITINSATNWTTATSLGNVTIDGAAFSDYVNAAAGDYRLATGSPAIGAAQPASASMGALQKAVSAAAQVSYGHAS